MKILLNAAMCKKCGDLLLSTDKKEIANCTCRNLTIFGGSKSTRREWKSNDKDTEAFKELSVAVGDNLSNEKIKAVEEFMFDKITGLLKEKAPEMLSGVVKSKGSTAMSIEHVKGDKSSDE